MAEDNVLGSVIDTEEDDKQNVNLIYKIDGKPNEIDVFELSRVLDSFGAIMREAYRLAHRNAGEMIVKVKPFEEGSFIIDINMYVQQHPGYLFLLSYPELRKQIKEALEAIGFIRDVKETGASLLELLRKLKNGKPEKVEKKGPDEYDFHAGDGSIIPVKSTVHALYNSPVINNYIFNVVVPAESEHVDSIVTYLKELPIQTQVKIGKADVMAVRAYKEPQVEAPKKEILEDTTIKILNPKSGNYGQTTGVWTFTISGTKQTLKARISDENFLRQYSDGTIRFYQGDKLKVKLVERQISEGHVTKAEYEIKEVLEYQQAHPSTH